MHSDTFHWISTFLEAQAAELGAATNTLLAYGRDLKDFDSYLARRTLDFTTATRNDVESYLVWCDAQGLAKSTRARRLSAVKQLYRFAFEEGLRDDNPAIQITGPGQEKRLPKVLSEDEVDRLLDAARNSGRSLQDQLRNTCLMELLYATGMRVSELVSLPVSATRGDPRLFDDGYRMIMEHTGWPGFGVIPWFADRYEAGRDWRDLAWWIDDHLPHSGLYFFPKNAAFNITRHETAPGSIASYIAPKGLLKRAGGEASLDAGLRRKLYADFPTFRGIAYPEPARVAA